MNFTVGGVYLNTSGSEIRIVGMFGDYFLGLDGDFQEVYFANGKNVEPDMAALLPYNDHETFVKTWHESETQKQVAEKLGLDERTVKQLGTVYRKLGINLPLRRSSYR